MHYFRNLYHWYIFPVKRARIKREVYTCSLIMTLVWLRQAALFPCAFSVERECTISSTCPIDIQHRYTHVWVSCCLSHRSKVLETKVDLWMVKPRSECSFLLVEVQWIHSEVVCVSVQTLSCQFLLWIRQIREEETLKKWSGVRIFGLDCFFAGHSWIFVPFCRMVRNSKSPRSKYRCLSLTCIPTWIRTIRIPG